MGNIPLTRKKPIVVTSNTTNIDKLFIEEYNTIFGEYPTITNQLIEHDSIILILYTLDDINAFNMFRERNGLEILAKDLPYMHAREVFIILAHNQNPSMDDVEDRTEFIFRDRFIGTYEFNEWNLYTKNDIWYWSHILESVKRNLGSYENINNINNSNTYNIQPNNNNTMSDDKKLETTNDDLINRINRSLATVNNPNYFDYELAIILGSTINNYIGSYDRFLANAPSLDYIKRIMNASGVRIGQSQLDPSIPVWIGGTTPITSNSVIYLFNWLGNKPISRLGRTIAVEDDHFIINVPMNPAMIRELIPRSFRTGAGNYIPFATRANPVQLGSERIQAIRIYRLTYDSAYDVIVPRLTDSFEDGGAYLVIYFPVLNRDAMAELRMQLKAGYGDNTVYEGLGFVEPTFGDEVDVDLGNTDETNMNIIMNKQLQEKRDAQLRAREQEQAGNNVNVFTVTDEMQEDIDNYERILANSGLPAEVEQEEVKEKDNSEEIETVLALSLRKMESMWAFLLALPQTVKGNIPYFGNPNVEGAINPDIAGNIAAMNPGLVDRVPDWLLGGLPQTLGHKIDATNQLNDLISERYLNPAILAARQNIPYFNTAFWWTMNKYNRITDNSAIVRMLIPVLMTTGLYLLLPMAKDEVVRITNDFINRNEYNIKNGVVTPEYLQDLLTEYDNDVKGIAGALGLITLPIAQLIDFISGSVVFNVNKGLSFVIDNNQFLNTGNIDKKINISYAPMPSDDDGGDDDFDDFGDRKPKLPMGDRPVPPGMAADKQLELREEGQNGSKLSVSDALSVLSELTSLSLSALGIIVNAASVVGSGVYWLVAGIAGLAYLWINRK